MRKIILNFFPVFIFFIVYKKDNIYSATIGLVIASIIQIIYEIIRYRKISIMNIITFLLGLFFGSATIYIHSETLIKWKVSITYWLLGIIFISSGYLMKKPIIQYLMEENIKLKISAWKVLNNIWGIFFTSLGILNFLIAYYCSTDTWVDFKVFGILGSSIIFIIFQGIFIAKYYND